MNDPCTDRKVNLIMRRDQNKVKGRFNVQRQGTYGRRDGREGRRRATMLDGGIPIRKLIRIQINIVYGWNGRLLACVTTPLKNFSKGFEFTLNVGLNWRTVVKQCHSAQPLAVRAWGRPKIQVYELLHSGYAVQHIYSTTISFLKFKLLFFWSSLLNRCDGVLAPVWNLKLEAPGFWVARVW